MKTIYLIFFCILNIPTVISQNDISFGYRQFKEYFDDSYRQFKTEKLIPQNAFTEFLYPVDYKQNVYGIERIDLNNDCELFILKRVVLFDDNDLNIDDKFYIVFKKEKLVGTYYFDDTSRCIETYIEGEGGIYSQRYTIDEDRTLIINLYNSDCCISTGFQIPIEVRSKARFYIDSKGLLKIKEVLNVEFSSKFFDVAYLKKVNDKSLYPTKDNPYTFHVYNNISTIPIYDKNIQIYFYIENVDNILYPCFVSTNKENKIIDTYLLGHDTPRIAKGAFKKESIYKHPVIIKSGNKRIIVDNSGYFLY